MELDELIERAIIGTAQNNPNWDMTKQMEVALFRYIEQFKNKEEHPVRVFCKYFSSKLKSTGQTLRKPVLDYSIKEDCDVALGFLDILYKYAKKKKDDRSMPIEELIDTHRYINGYLNILYKCATSDKHYADLISSSNSPLNDLKRVIYKNPTILQELVSKDLIGIKQGNSMLAGILNIYIKDLAKKDVLGMNSIDIIEVTDTAKTILTNIRGNSIIDSFSGSLFNGGITIASDRGYINRPERPQEDSVWVGTKSDDCFLAIVADGAGGAQNGDIASMSVIKELAMWFDEFSLNELETMNDLIIEEMIDQRLKKVNNDLVKKYYGKSYSTVVFALSIGNRTIIGNIGDSTAYTYDEQEDQLKLHTSLDSASKGKGYEEARINPENNIITKAVGAKPYLKSRPFAYYETIENLGQTLLLSSDGVTDLIKESRLKKYFIKKADAFDIVERAVHKPDTFKIKDSHGKAVNGKSADNVSAIVINLPNIYDKNKKSDRRI